MLGPHKAQCHTVTFDNGKEFAGHEAIAVHLQAAVDFAHPYHSWERGVNEKAVSSNKRNNARHIRAILFSKWDY
jgi:IS30 family transposase